MGKKVLRVQRCLDTDKLKTLSVKAKKKLIERQQGSQKSKPGTSPRAKKVAAAGKAATAIKKSPKGKLNASPGGLKLNYNQECLLITWV